MSMDNEAPIKKHMLDLEDRIFKLEESFSTYQNKVAKLVGK